MVVQRPDSKVQDVITSTSASVATLLREEMPSHKDQQSYSSCKEVPCSMSPSPSSSPSISSSLFFNSSSSLSVPSSPCSSTILQNLVDHLQLLQKTKRERCFSQLLAFEKVLQSKEGDIVSRLNRATLGNDHLLHLRNEVADWRLHLDKARKEWDVSFVAERARLQGYLESYSNERTGFFEKIIIPMEQGSFIFQSQITEQTGLRDIESLEEKALSVNEQILFWNDLVQNQEILLNEQEKVVGQLMQRVAEVEGEVRRQVREAKQSVCDFAQSFEEEQEQEQELGDDGERQTEGMDSREQLLQQGRLGFDGGGKRRREDSNSLCTIS
jgi:hypothetical protein